MRFFYWNSDHTNPDEPAVDPQKTAVMMRRLVEELRAIWPELDARMLALEQAAAVEEVERLLGLAT